MESTTEQGSPATIWTTRLRDWRATGQSQKAYCESHALSYHQFTYWRRKLDGSGKQGKATITGAGFVPVIKGRDSGLGGLTISLPNGVQIQGVGAEHVAWMKSLADSLL